MEHHKIGWKCYHIDVTWDGCTKTESVAKELSYSEGHIRATGSKLMEKLGFRNVRELVVWGAGRGDVRVKKIKLYIDVLQSVVYNLCKWKNMLLNISKNVI